MVPPGGEPGYIQTNNSTVQTQTQGGVVQMRAVIPALWGGFGKRSSTPQNWSEYDAITFGLTNHKNYPVSLVLMLEPSTNPDSPLCERVRIDIPAMTTKLVAFDLRPERAAALGMRALPPLFNEPHIRVYSGKTLQLQHVYGWWLYNREAVSVDVTISDFKVVKRPTSYSGAIDSFGQHAPGSWNMKAYSTTDLMMQRQAETADNNRYVGPGEQNGTFRLPPVGGTGRWRTHRTPSGKWYIVHPNGRLFWSMGMCAVRPDNPTVVANRQGLFSDLPPNSGSTAQFYGSDSQGQLTFDFHSYNLSKKFGGAWRTEFANTAMKRLKSWGFNTLGPWSDEGLYARNELPYTITTNSNEYSTRLSTPFAYWVTLPDPYGLDFQVWLANKLNSQLQGHKNRATFMGIYVDNELSWGLMDSTATRFQIAIAALNASNGQPAKAAFISQLQAKYGTITAMNNAWNTSFASWAALQNPGVFNPSSFTTQCQEDMRLFVIEFAKTYYQKVKGALNSVGCHALYLGSRDAWATPETTLAAMDYVDVYSVNLYRLAGDVNWNFPESSKPVIISEFSFGSTDQGSFHPGPVGLPDSTTRGAAMRAFAMAAIRAPKVVGITWFEYKDHPATGRAQDGENYNVGFVNVNDAPYDTLVSGTRGLGSVLYILRGR